MSSVPRAEMAPHGPDSPELLTDESPAELTQADVNRLPETRWGNILGVCAEEDGVSTSFTLRPIPILEGP